MLLEKRDLSFPRPGAAGKTAYEKHGESLSEDLVMEIDVPNVAKGHWFSPLAAAALFRAFVLSQIPFSQNPQLRVQ
jgi:hypothetical protein